MIHLFLACFMALSLAILGAGEASATSYYNSMLTGGDRSIQNCQDVYRDADVDVIKSCGYGMDATCNKRIKYEGIGGINAVRDDFDHVISDLQLDLQSTINSKKSCEF